MVSAFWKSATLNGLDINQLMRQVSVGNSIGGRVAVVVDNNFPRGLNADGTERVLSVEDIDGSPGKIYAYLVPTKDTRIIWYVGAALKATHSVARLKGLTNV